MVRTERQHDRVVARRGLELEVERAAELLAQREPERAVDPAAVRRVDHELHAAGVVEEPLEDERLHRRHRAEHGAAERDVVDDHRRRVGLRPASSHQPLPRARRGRRAAGIRRPVPAAATPLPRARRCAPAPRRVQNGTVGAALPTSSTRTTPASIRRICHECVPSRKMSPAIDSTAQSSFTVPMNRVVGFGDDAVVADLGDRTAGRQCGEPRAPAAAHLAVDGVVVHVPAARPATGLHALGRERRAPRRTASV